MKLTWTEKMGSVGSTPELEEVTRAAVLIACEHMRDMPRSAERPVFWGTTIARPTNKAAKDLSALILKDLPFMPGIERERIIQTAVHCADMFVRGGTTSSLLEEFDNDLGMAALMKFLDGARKKR